MRIGCLIMNGVSNEESSYNRPDWGWGWGQWPLMLMIIIEGGLSGFATAGREVICLFLMVYG